MLGCEMNPMRIFLHFFFFTVFKKVFFGGCRKRAESHAVNREGD